MYLSVCLYICFCMYVYVRACVCVCLSVCLCMYMCIRYVMYVCLRVWRKNEAVWQATCIREVNNFLHAI